MLDTQIGGEFFIGGRIQSPVSTGLFRWLFEALQMIFQAGLPLQLVIGIAIQSMVMRDNPTIDLIQPDLVAIFDGMRFLASANDICVRLELCLGLVHSRLSEHGVSTGPPLSQPEG